MELTPKQQAIELIRNSKRILIASHISPDGDSFGSLIALTLALKKSDKEVVTVCTDPVPEYLQFLPGLDLITNELSGAKDFIITVDLSQTDVDKLGYKRLAEEKKLHIVITPTQGFFEPENVSFSQGMPRFDLIITLDCTDLDRLGSIYDNNTALFYETPVVNIDHHVSNDHYGKVNWIDLTATSTAEILVALLESLGREKNLLDPDIATALLTGITTDTGSFQNANTTPKSFTVAAQLVAAGAKQQDIVKHIYKTRPLATLKIWGKVLSNVQEDNEYKFIWSTISQKDLAEVGVDDEYGEGGVIDELLKTAPNINFALLLSERKGGVHGNLRAVEKGVDVAHLADLFGGGGHEAAAGFDIPNTTLEKEESSILDRIRAEYKK